MAHIVSQTHSGHEGGEKRDRRAPPNEGSHGHIFTARYFQNKDGLYIHYKKWTAGTPNGHVVVISHGLGEHCARYEHVAAALCDAGFTVFALDHQGHGASDGDRIFVGDGAIWDFVDDVIQLTQQVAAPQGKAFLMGHSMGGLIAICAGLKAPELFSGFVLSGPAILADPKVATPVNKFLAKSLSSVVPKLELDKLDTFGLARSETVVMQYKLDPLNNHRGMTVRIGATILGGMDIVQERKGSFKQPFLMQIGTCDPLVMPDGGRDFFASAASADKQKLEYEGWFHEIYNECEEDCELQVSEAGVTTNRAVRDAVSWLKERAGESVIRSKM